MVERWWQKKEDPPGMTISPSPSMPKLLAARPFSRISIGNITSEKGEGGKVK